MMRALGCAGMFLLAATAGGVARGQPTLAEIHEATNVSLALSPDGQTLVTDLLERLWTLPATGGAATPLTPPDSPARHPRFSPDGTRLVYQQRVDGQWDVWQLSLADGTAEPLTGPPYDETEPDFAPDGRRIVLVSNRSGQRTLWELEVDSGRFARLGFEPGAAAFPSVSDQGVVAYVAELGDTWILRIQTPSGFTTDLNHSPRPLGPPSWRPGGGALVFSEQQPLERSDLRLLLLSQAPLFKTLTQDEDVFPGRVAWTRAGDILYAADGRFWRRGIALPTRYPIRMFAAVTVPDSPPPAQSLQLALDSDGGAAEPASAPQPSPGGAHTVLSALGDLWLGDSRSRWHRLTDDPYVDFDPVFASDEEIVFASDRSGNIDLWRLNVPRELFSQLTRAQEKEYAPVIAPDGRAVAFLATGGLGPWAPHSLQLLRFDAPDETRTLAYGLIGPTRPEWAADGSALLVSVTQAPGATAGGSLRFEVTPPHGPTPRSDEPTPVPSTPGVANIDWSAQPHTGRYVIQVGRVFDGIGTQYRHHVDVHVDGNRIAAVVGRGLAALPETVIDAHDLTLVPGFLDLHAHPTDLAGERLGRAWLYYGVTTIQDAGDDAGAAVARGQAWATGRRPGPRVFRAAGASSLDPAQGTAEPRTQIVGVAAIDLLARQRLSPAHPVLAISGPARLEQPPPAGPTIPALSPLGRAYQDVVSVLVGSGQVFIPTLGALRNDWQRHVPARELQAYQGLFAPQEHPAPTHDGNGPAAAMAATAAAVLGAGGRVGLGSDAPALPYGLGMHAEMSLLSESGMPNDQILRIATTGGALALGLEANLGSIEGGKLADFVLLRGDPLTRIADTLSIVAIVKDGHWYDREALLTPDSATGRSVVP